MAQSWFVIMLAGIASIVSLVGIIWAIILVIVHGRRCPAAARLVWTAVSLKTFTVIFWPIASMLLMRFLGATEMGRVLVIMRPIMAMLEVVVLLLLVNAAFVARAAPTEHFPSDANRDPGDPPAPVDPNPYSTPR